MKDKTLLILGVAAIAGLYLWKTGAIGGKRAPVNPPPGAVPPTSQQEPSWDDLGREATGNVIDWLFGSGSPAAAPSAGPELLNW